MRDTKRDRRPQITDDACRRIVEWKKLKDLCRELGVPKKTAENIRSKHKQVFQ